MYIIFGKINILICILQTFVYLIHILINIINILTQKKEQLITSCPSRLVFYTKSHIAHSKVMCQSMLFQYLPYNFLLHSLQDNLQTISDTSLVISPVRYATFSPLVFILSALAISSTRCLNS